MVNRPTSETARDITAALGLDKAGASRSRRRKWVWIAVVALLIGGAVAAYSTLGGSAEKIVYTTVPAETGDLTIEISATGTLQPLTQVDISSELSGVMRTVNVDENQEVEKGQVLAELDTTRLAAQIERAEASAKAAEAKVTDTRTTLEETRKAQLRAQELSRRGMTTDQALETATAARDRAASALDIAEANLAIAVADLKLQQADLVKSKIYAPIDGVVLTRSVNPGQTVASSMQAPVLFVIAADLKHMELKAAIDEADIGMVQKGQSSRFTVDAFPDRRFDAEIRDIAFASVTTDGVVTYDARLDVDNNELLLRPGMTATVSVVTRQAQDVVTVPTAAFRFRPAAPAQRNSGFSFRNILSGGMMGPPRGMGGGMGGGTRAATAVQPADGSRTLFVLENGVAKSVQVKTGANDGDRTEIVSGLEAGAQVITGSSTARN